MCNDRLRHIDNEDWEVTKEIYANSIVEHGIVDIEIRMHDLVGIRRVLPSSFNSSTNSDNGSSEDDEGDSTGIQSVFQFTSLSKIMQEQKQPSVRLSFHYDGECILCSVEVAMMYIPSIFTDLKLSPTTIQSLRYDKNVNCGKNEYCSGGGVSTEEGEYNLHELWLGWLQSSANEILNETKLSFSVCNFIELQALSFFHILDNNDGMGYSAIIFNDKIGFEKKKNHYDNNKNGTCSVHPHLRRQNRPAYVSPAESFWLNAELYKTTFNTRKGVQNKIDQTTIESYAKFTIQKYWKEWIDFECPICFDVVTCSKGVELPCRHFLCTNCANMYIQTKLTELHMYRHSPFICPVVSCKLGMKIKSGVYPMNDGDRKRIDDWKFNLSHPKTQMLIQCPRKCCRSTDMRRVTTEFTDTMVFCNSCEKAYCELCIKKYKDRELRRDHELHVCDESIVLKLCRRYKAAKDEIKLKAEAKWAWLKDYAEAREEDISAKLWVSEHASRCPNCRTAIERIEGCFHIHCTFCGTHFCYECGDELHYPYYGTHHCWEENRPFDEL